MLKNDTVSIIVCLYSKYLVAVVYNCRLKSTGIYSILLSKKAYDDVSDFKIPAEIPRDFGI